MVDCLTHTGTIKMSQLKSSLTCLTIYRPDMPNNYWVHRRRKISTNKLLFVTLSSKGSSIFQGKLSQTHRYYCLSTVPPPLDRKKDLGGGFGSLPCSLSFGRLAGNKNDRPRLTVLGPMEFDLARLAVISRMDGVHMGNHSK